MKPESKFETGPESEFQSPSGFEEATSPEIQGTEAWRRLVEARRAVLDAHDSGNGEAPLPFGFAARVAAMGVARWRDAPMTRWTRWSLRGAWLSAAAAILVAAWPAPVRTDSPLLRAPALTIPALAPL